MAQKGQREPSHTDDDQTMPSAEPRQPQLNSAICGCQCGRGFQGYSADKDGGGDGDADQSYLQGEEGVGNTPYAVLPTAPVQRATSQFDTRYADFEVGHDGFRYGARKLVMENPFQADPHLQLYARAESPDSLAIQFHNSSEEPSLSSSGLLTRRSESPGPVFKGVGEWAGYFFSSPPLPLNPLWQIPPQPRFPPIGGDPAPYIYPESILSEDLNENMSTD